jgi:glucosamine--fructose-6-phosphate aminotransferase (isomerizing)
VSGSERLLAEIREQPQVLERVRGNGAAIAALGERLRAAPPRLIRLAGHGTSDNAATYGVYAFGIAAGMTAIRDSVSLPAYAGVRSRADGDVAIGLSQSGATPDIVRWLARMREAGALGVAITNDPASPLAQIAEVVLELQAGEERSVAATKTYTAQLAVLARLAGHAGTIGDELDAGLEVTADRLADALSLVDGPVEAAAEEFAGTDRLIAIGRGPELASARETALKLTEVCRLGAVAMTSTDLAHGPLAALDGGFPVWACAADDVMLPALQEAARRVRETGAPLLVAGPAALAIPGARHLFAVPAPGHPLLSPLVTVLPGQLFARALAERKGLDPGAPRNLRKVTLAL